MARVLIACEYSGRVREAFRAQGHDAWSCDLLPAEDGSEYHIRNDVFVPLRGRTWDLLVAHPPCTHLAVSGAKHFAAKQASGVQQEALEFVRKLLDAPVPRIALENPVSIISSRVRRPDQVIQPWMFGHEETKTTCLWLKNLPLLVPTKVVGKSYSCACGAHWPEALGPACRHCDGRSKVVLGYGQKSITKSGKVLPKWYNLPPSESRWKERSRTFQGIASAMATQWGATLN